MEEALFAWLLRQGDNALLSGHRLSEWSSKGPSLEDDIALSNLALDLIGQATAWLSYAGEIEGQGRDEDALAYHRDVPAWRNDILTEWPRGDFAFTIARHAMLSAVMEPFSERLCQSTDTQIAAIAAKSVKEWRYHMRYAGEWLIRLGDGTEESHERAQSAVNQLWPLCQDLWRRDPADAVLIETGIIVDAEALEAPFRETMTGLLTEATLDVPEDTPSPHGGRGGLHTEHLGYLLAEMQYLQRAYPGATW